MTELFGTDGIRGRADKKPFNRETLNKLGYSIASLIENNNPILIARDTRESGERITDQLAEGLAAGNISVHTAGILPTPSLSFILNKLDKYNMGIMISASHNPFHDNGIKILTESGQKVPDDLEIKIEEKFDKIKFKPIATKHLKIIDVCKDVEDEYITSITDMFSKIITKKIDTAVLDCANGAAYRLAPDILKQFVKKLHVINYQPDGKNINKNCGSTDLTSLKQAVIDTGAEIGIALDGDGDRALFIDHSGNTVDGDHILAIAGLHMKASGKIQPASRAGIVTTVMANFGIERLMKKENISLYRTKVGDKYVYEKMLETDSLVGGEQSGHIIFREHSATGDGIISALKLIEFMSKENKPLSELASVMKKYPQTLLNLPVERKIPLEKLSILQNKLDEIHANLNGNGRIVLRYSGTENLLRIMIEGREAGKIEKYAKEIASVADEEIKKELS